MSSPRIALRPFQASDAEALFPIFADPRAMLYWSTPPHASIDATAAFVRATMEATASSLGDDQVVVYEGRVIGKAGLWDNREVGFILAPDMWGKGLAREAVEAVIARARSRGLTRIAADVDPRNAASIGLLNRLGFVQTGEAKATAKVGDEWVDSLYFELVLT
jgi:ribosomal-protein-alanine N-acetyltransferase